MKLSESWLREWVDPSIGTDELVHQITMAGLEVDGVEPAAAEFSGVVVGQIESITAHPDAEKLRVCQVTNGSETVQVVCGAPNATEGIKIPFAQVGASLPPGEDGKPFNIKKAKLRGVESFGMLCGASELGLEDIIDGLMVLPVDAPLGEDVRAYLGLDDSIIEVDLTPNRGDCLSLLGVAREVSVICEADFNRPEITPVPATIDDQVAVSIEADDYCQAYAGRVVKDVDVSVETPIWMREILRRSGLRSIDPVVDITNYVLLELGQPMHAFDLDKLNADGGDMVGNGRIIVRYAKQGEKIELLDGSELEADDDLLMIADDQQALALAGIMGGASSAVSETTKNILFESAFFVPHIHAGKARRLGMHTDSSHRFERGVDWKGQVAAIERATALLLEICGGQAGPIVEQRVTDKAQKTIDFRRSNIKRVLGFELSDAEVEKIFSSLDLSPAANDAGWQVTVPSHRFDLAIEADLLEEIARVYGYDRLPVEPPVAAMTFTLKPEEKRDPQTLRQTLVARGYREAISYSFIDPALHTALYGDLPAVKLANPISEEMSVMRVSLVPGLLKSAEQNVKRQQSRLKLFEVGLSFAPGSTAETSFEQTPRIAGLVYGTRAPETWLSKPEAVQSRGKSADLFDFYDIKSDVNALLAGIDSELANSVEFRSIVDQDGQLLPECEPLCSKMLHPGQSAAIFLANQYLGFCGAIHPALQKTLDEVTSAWVFELDMTLISLKKVPEFKELSKFPEVRRDIAIIVDDKVAVGQLLKAIYAEGGESLTSASVFDQYSGEGIEQGKQSVAIGLHWQHQERTLKDAEVNEQLDNIVASLSKQFNASLR